MSSMSTLRQTLSKPLKPRPLRYAVPFCDNAGFTLMEVLVATAITGIALGVLLSSFALGHRQSFRGDLARKAAIAAETVLAMYDRDPDGFPQADSGDVPGMEEWKYSIESRELILHIKEPRGDEETETETAEEGIEIPELMEVSLRIIPPENAHPFILTLWVNSGAQ